ncbi:MAG: hypothetical protein O7F16_00535, partial [Acidobacteria bacterium]|nr:hypothetical protein [Acidobacteriota bacterium]
KGKLQKILGHSSGKTTDRYVHTGAEYIDSARQHLGRSAIMRRMESGHLSGHLEANPKIQ